MHATLDTTARAGGALTAQASNLDALMIEVSLTAGLGTITVCGHDDGEPELVAVRPQTLRAEADAAEADWDAQADAVIFGWLVWP